MSDILERLQTRITLLRQHHLPRMTIGQISVLEGAADDLEAAAKYIRALESAGDGPKVAADSDATTNTRSVHQLRRAEIITRAR